MTNDERNPKHECRREHSSSGFVIWNLNFLRHSSFALCHSLSVIRHSSFPLAIACLGLSAFLTQLTLMRELLGVLSGNELVFGVVLGSWMLLTGIGSALGRAASRLRSPFVVFVGRASAHRPAADRRRFPAADHEKRRLSPRRGNRHNRRRGNMLRLAGALLPGHRLCAHRGLPGGWRAT